MTPVQLLTLGNITFEKFSDRGRDLLVLRSELGIGREDFFQLLQQRKEHSAFGRGGAERIMISGISVVVRHSRRGGMFGPLLGERYFLSPFETLSATRQVSELRALMILEEAGCSVPRPLGAYVERTGKFSYRGLVMTEEVQGRNFLEICHRLPIEDAIQIVRKTARAANACLASKVVHRDLHLGNILCTADNVVLIDFDRCKILSSLDALAPGRELLAERWMRSCQRHERPEFVAPFIQELAVGSKER